MVPVGGLEPPRPKATDFESVVYTNFTTPAHIISQLTYSGKCPSVSKCPVLYESIVRRQSANRNKLKNAGFQVFAESAGKQQVAFARPV